MNSVFSFNKYKKKFFIFGCWLLPEKFCFCPKNNGFARVWGLQPLAPWLVRLWSVCLSVCLSIHCTMLKYKHGQTHMHITLISDTNFIASKCRSHLLPSNNSGQVVLRLKVSTFIYRHLQGTGSGWQFEVAYWPVMTLGGAVQLAAAHCLNERTLDPAVCS